MAHPLPQVIIETKADALLTALRLGTVSNNVFLRRLTNFCVDMNWLLWPLIPKRLWPDVRFKDQCAITGNDRRQKAKPSSCPRFRRCATGLPVWGRRSAESRAFLCTWA